MSIKPLRIKHCHSTRFTNNPRRYELYWQLAIAILHGMSTGGINLSGGVSVSATWSPCTQNEAGATAACSEKPISRLPTLIISSECDKGVYQIDTTFHSIYMLIWLPTTPGFPPLPGTHSRHTPHHCALLKGLFGGGLSSMTL